MRLPLQFRPRHLYPLRNAHFQNRRRMVAIDLLEIDRPIPLDVIEQVAEANFRQLLLNAVDRNFQPLSALRLAPANLRPYPRIF